MIEIFPWLSIPENEVRFTASRSSGPGGQNVNKVNTRVTLYFDIEASEALSEEQKARLRERLTRRISQDGVLQISSQSERTQLANRITALEKFTALLRKSLTVHPPRKKKPTSFAAKQRRLEAKRQHSERKSRRNRVDWEQ
ncbi:MAG TPA: alternative ribosome rescue aminoacyl-tRNA hydrolase ArfB [bacterium]|jgi:ribosome-associated protein|nr:alternative ribosome rescue aminoacyl-tRNA hydrolase ArfB [bacterium]HNT66422.1 alternative ribosome rescue aminoacyl-tRNA hydrolase ArfB [bacterium]HOX85056.1 alternative ribosome rescue aminoacyl-tRNA hydrolase ArfB [bacterium]HPG44078.1 alternative ribosome rescue aminoacyl-tRNA hydrolase ArfB [bacterium]HPM96444.1 alternative ribosome rescue aminoacyl-tRNA hydrolase ArfB [bacterium]